MKLIFFDESKNDAAYPYYHIGGVCIDEAQLAGVEEKIAAMAEKAFGTAELKRETELHAAHIFGRKGNFRDNDDFDKSLMLLSDLADVLSLPQVSRIYIKINCDRIYGSRTAAEHAFMHLVERANGLLNQTQSLGMLIGDRENDSVADELAVTLSGYRARGTDYYYGRDITRLVDSVHFTHSHLSRFLQLADAYAWFSQFRIRHQDPQTDKQRAVLKMLARPEVQHFPNTYKDWPPPR
jgi:hypothetical protein